jgi:glycosyltransferase involved in cell wall biosynthesis
MPRVTVITATYNWAPVLPYSIASVLDQTFADFELLVIGDGCTDESADVVQAIEDRRVHWHNLAQNTGHQWGPNNEGLRLAAGDLIAYLGHDDLWLPHHLESLVAAMDHGPRLAHTTVMMVWPDKPATRSPNRAWKYQPGEWIAPTSLMHDRDLALAVGGWQSPRLTGALEPEAQLCQAMARAATPPQWVRRITCVKLPAALRRDVYRDRPHHEQETWLRDIRSHADPEAAFEQMFPESVEPSHSIAQRAVVALRTKVALRSRLRRAAGLRDMTQTAEQRRLERRVFKGLDD